MSWGGIGLPASGLDTGKPSAIPEWSSAVSNIDKLGRFGLIAVKFVK